MEPVLYWLIRLTGLYLLSGAVFAIPFLVKGITVTDPEGAAGSNWAFRLIIFPGTLVFWPMLLRKWIRVRKNNNDKSTT